jgi:arsenite methyltransferase
MKLKEFVKKRYGEIATTEESCCSSTCCASSATDVALRIGYSEEDLRRVPAASSMGLGCGNPVAIAELKEGETVVDLGSGGGIDVFLAAHNVGAAGKVIGVDMTEEMITKARDIAAQYGYENVEFRLGEIEDLPIEDGAADVVISNCVVSLSPDKEQVFREAYRVLKPEGRLFISDLVTEGDLPLEVKQSLGAWACCIAGALEKGRYLETIRRAGFKAVRINAESTYDIDVSQDLRGKITSVQVEAHRR